eukprot:1195716-Prorocentrum_minimum.AAC.3
MLMLIIVTEQRPHRHSDQPHYCGATHRAPRVTEQRPHRHRDQPHYCGATHRAPRGVWEVRLPAWILRLPAWILRVPAWILRAPALILSAPAWMLSRCGSCCFCGRWSLTGWTGSRRRGRAALSPTRTTCGRYS